MKKVIKEILEFSTIVPTLALYHLINEHVVSVNQAEGNSMNPIIKDSQILVVDKLFYKFSGIKQHDVIIA